MSTRFTRLALTSLAFAAVALHADSASACVYRYAYQWVCNGYGYCAYQYMWVCN